MDRYIEPHQRAGYLKFLAVFVVMALFVHELWGALLGFLYVMVVVGIPGAIASWLVGKWIEVNDSTEDSSDPQKVPRIFEVGPSEKASRTKI